MIIEPDLALLASQAMCRDASVALELPGNPVREALLYGLAAAHQITGKGWDLAHAREHVSLTLPGGGDGVDLLGAIPYVGGLLRDICRDLVHPTVWLAPAALADGAALLGVVRHELGHVGQIRVGSLPWCFSYGVIDEVRAAAESTCYIADATARVILGGEPVDDVERGLVGALDGYGLDKPSHDFAAGVIRSAAVSLRRGGDPGGIAAELERALRAAGWRP